MWKKYQSYRMPPARTVSAVGPRICGVCRSVYGQAVRHLTNSLPTILQAWRIKNPIRKSLINITTGDRLPLQLDVFHRKQLHATIGQSFNLCVNLRDQEGNLWSTRSYVITEKQVFSAWFQLLSIFEKPISCPKCHVKNVQKDCVSECLPW